MTHLMGRVGGEDCKGKDISGRNIHCRIVDVGEESGECLQVVNEVTFG